MKIDPATHREKPWRVHTLAPDFQLLDLWQFELGTERSLDEVLERFWSTFRQLGEASWLARARLRIGRAMKWDDHDFTLPIPGCVELAVGERLDSTDRDRSRAGTDAPSPIESPVVRTIYVFDDEALYEASNDTIHLMLHVAVVRARATLAVYIKSRGVFSRAYMAAIGPARHLAIYPAFTRRFEASWR
jgi:Protein of unknown function (DUF2867)